MSDGLLTQGSFQVLFLPPEAWAFLYGRLRVKSQQLSALATPPPKMRPISPAISLAAATAASDCHLPVNTHQIATSAILWGNI